MPPLFKLIVELIDCKDMRNINNRHFARPRRIEGENIVQNNLAYTPSQMMELAERGIPISNQMVSPDNFFDGVSEGLSFELPLDRRRGVDVADCWQAEQSIKKKAKKGLKNDIFKYGATPIVEKGE